MKYGALRLRTLAFDLPEGAAAKTVAVTCAGKALAAVHRTRARRVVIELKAPALAKAGEAFEVTIDLAR